MLKVYGSLLCPDCVACKKAFEEKADQEGIIVQNGIEYQANVTYLEDFDWAIVQCVETEEIFKDLSYIDLWRQSSLIIVFIIILCVVRITLYWHRSDKKINTDTLTGCSSRAAMQNLLERLEYEKQSDIGVIYLDLNKFKYVNDTYGHEVGDEEDEDGFFADPGDEVIHGVGIGECGGVLHHEGGQVRAHNHGLASDEQHDVEDGVCAGGEEFPRLRSLRGGLGEAGIRRILHDGFAPCVCLFFFFIPLFFSKSLVQTSSSGDGTGIKG